MGETTCLTWKNFICLTNCKTCLNYNPFSMEVSWGLAIDMPFIATSTKLPCFGQKSIFTFNKIIRKVRKRCHHNPLFGHIMDEISKNREKKYIRFQRGMKLNLVANLALNWVYPSLSFLECLQQITIVMCIITIIVLELGAFTFES